MDWASFGQSVSAGIIAAGTDQTQSLNSGSFALAVASGVITAAVGLVGGYFVGIWTAFRHRKQGAYEELLPPIIKAAFKPEGRDEPAFNRALLQVWLYASKKAARKINTAVGIMHNRCRGNLIEALQEAVAAARDDMQFCSWRQRLKSEEIDHIYSILQRAPTPVSGEPDGTDKRVT